MELTCCIVDTVKNRKKESPEGINYERILEQIVALIGEKEKTFTEMVKTGEKS